MACRKPQLPVLAAPVRSAVLVIVVEAVTNHSVDDAFLPPPPSRRPSGARVTRLHSYRAISRYTRPRTGRLGSGTSGTAMRDARADIARRRAPCVVPAERRAGAFSRSNPRRAVVVLTRSDRQPIRPRDVLVLPAVAVCAVPSAGRIHAGRPGSPFLASVVEPSIDGPDPDPRIRPGYRTADRGRPSA